MLGNLDGAAHLGHIAATIALGLVEHLHHDGIYREGAGNELTDVLQSLELTGVLTGDGLQYSLGEGVRVRDALQRGHVLQDSVGTQARDGVEGLAVLLHRSIDGGDVDGVVVVECHIA